MATSKHRKNHKKKLAAFKTERKGKLNTIINLSKQLGEEISKLTPTEPTYPIVRTSSPALTLTGSENNTDNYELNQMAL